MKGARKGRDKKAQNPFQDREPGWGSVGFTFLRPSSLGSHPEFLCPPKQPRAAPGRGLRSRLGGGAPAGPGLSVGVAAPSPSPRAPPPGLEPLPARFPSLLSPPFPFLPARLCLRLLRPQSPLALSPPESERGEGAPPAPPQRADSRLPGSRPVPSSAGHTPAPPLLRQFPPDPPGGEESGRASRRAAAAAAARKEGARDRPTGNSPGRTAPACAPGPSPPRGRTCGCREPGQRSAWQEWRAAPRGHGKREKAPEPGRDAKVTPPGGATRFVGEDARLLRPRCHRGGRGEAEEPLQALCEYCPQTTLRRAGQGPPGRLLGGPSPPPAAKSRS